MLSDSEFSDLRIRASVCPSAESWPTEDDAKPVSVIGDTLTWDIAPHWSYLRSAVNTARDSVAAAFSQIAAVEADSKLSASGKSEAKHKIATAALEGLKKSAALDRARESVSASMTRWDEQSGLKPRPPSSAEEIALTSEVRKHISSLKKEARVPFIANHIKDQSVVQAVLGGAPAFLSGLDEAAMEIVRHQCVKINAPEIYDLRAATEKALAETESGWRNAATAIAKIGGLKQSINGGFE